MIQKLGMVCLWCCKIHQKILWLFDNAFHTYLIKRFQKFEKNEIEKKFFRVELERTKKGSQMEQKVLVLLKDPGPPLI